MAGCWPLASLLCALALSVPSGGAEGAKAPDVTELVRQAGFRAIPADTPEKLARLEQLTPALVVVPRERDGERIYTLADPYVCRCLYVGGETEYIRFRHLSAGAHLEQETRQPLPPTTFDWEYWSPGLRR